MVVDPTRNHFPENEEGMVPLFYAFLYGTDTEEGLEVLGPIGTFIDGEDRNNFVDKAKHPFNPDGKLKDAMNVQIFGSNAYVSTKHGLYVVDIKDPFKPEITAEFSEPFIKNPHAVRAQFKYAFVVDDEGLKVLDITNLAKPKPIEKATLHLEDAHNLCLGRTYAYVAAGKQGLVIVDISKPMEPKVDQTFNAGGEMNDTEDVKIGMNINTLFAYVADGKNGLRVVQLVGWDENPDVYGWSPRPRPKLIATYETEGEALAISDGLTRDRAMDESGNQLSVFGRRGAHPLDATILNTLKKTVVSNDPPKPPKAFKRPTATAAVYKDEDLLYATYASDRKEMTEEAKNTPSSTIPLVSFALVFLPLAIMLSRRKK